MLRRFSLCWLLTLSFIMTDAQPPGKHWEAVAYDETNNELAVFGGVEFTNHHLWLTDSLWLYNGKWKFVDNNSITGRWAHGMAYHGNALYVYGGLMFDANQQEVALFDLYRFRDTWEKVTEGPKLSMPTLFSWNGQLMLAGLLFDDKNIFEVWALEGNALRRQLSIPLIIDGEGIRIFPFGEDYVVVYNNSAGLVFSNVSKGLSLQIEDIPKRTKYGMTYNQALKSYFLFGGLDSDEDPSNDLWQIKNGITNRIGGQSGPTPRSSCSLLPTERGFILYGGTESGGKLSTEIWRYEEGKWSRFE